MFLLIIIYSNEVGGMKKSLFESFEDHLEEEEYVEADDMGLSPEEAAFLRGYDEAG